MVPLVWVMWPSNVREYKGVRTALDILFRLWPDCDLQYLVGDTEYDQDGRLARDLEARYCIHAAFYPRGTPGQEYAWHDTMGTPVCAKHGLMMKLNQSYDFPPAGRKGREYLRTNQAVEGTTYDVSQARHRWFCPICVPHTRPRAGDPTVITRFADNPRLYPYLPFQGDHKRVGLRMALSHRRNHSESLNAQLQAYGLGLKGKATAYWMNNDGDGPGYAGIALLSQTLRRLAHATGAYAEHLAEAYALGMLKPETAEDYAQWLQAAGLDPGRDRIAA
jgi:hypothetical protein